MYIKAYSNNYQIKLPTNLFIETRWVLKVRGRSGGDRCRGVTNDISGTTRSAFQIPHLQLDLVVHAERLQQLGRAKEGKP